MRPGSTGSALAPAHSSCGCGALTSSYHNQRPGQQPASPVSEHPGMTARSWPRTHLCTALSLPPAPRLLLCRRRWWRTWRAAPARATAPSACWWVTRPSAGLPPTLGTPQRAAAVCCQQRQRSARGLLSRAGRGMAQPVLGVGLTFNTSPFTPPPNTHSQCHSHSALLSGVRTRPCSRSRRRICAKGEIRTAPVLGRPARSPHASGCAVAAMQPHLLPCVRRAV